ncbi:CRISPR-associated protein Cas2 [Marivirga salinae]|uniref:CRISPR-associated protein Cas2 n=1 Tax=Marivirga salinarum TaxID=3059078 RepID=A0AA49GBU1_9BACT|nr:CRISPR-associated protein Cas2 [Marivirga sp. BDSF4-3]WKK75331.1 CRISPR-associated protein Cas2 [Marivirga sp. BDSF4-3]
MTIYTISYDLSNPGRDYDSLSNAIKSYGNWWHQSGSVWIIASINTNSASIRDYLKQFIDSNDKLFVAKLHGEWAGYGFTKEEYDWMKSKKW